MEGPRVLWVLQTRAARREWTGPLKSICMEGGVHLLCRGVQEWVLIGMDLSVKRKRSTVNSTNDFFTVQEDQYYYAGIYCLLDKKDIKKT
jgi:hypothetical protein